LVKMTPIDANLSNQIEQDITWSLEQGLEDSTKTALENLQKKWSLSQEELTDLYEANFKNMVSWSIDDGSVLVEKVKNLTSVENKLLATYMAQAKEKNDEPHAVKRALYWTCSIDTDIQKNNTAQNIIKGVIDEILSIPEMLWEILKNPRQFGKWLYEALVKNFSQTMKAIKESYTDILGGADTPESAYKTGRSGVLIILTFFPGAIGKNLIRIGRVPGIIAKAGGRGAKKVWKVAWNLWKKAFPKSAESVSKNAPKVVDKAKNVIQWKNEALNKAKAGVGAELAKLKKRIDQSKLWRAGAKGVEIGKKWVAKLKQGVNWMDNLALVNDILRLPIRLAKGVTVLLWKIIPRRFQPRLIKDIAEIAAINKKLININTRIAKYPNNLDLVARKNVLESSLAFAKDFLRKDLINTSVWLAVIGTSEINDIMNEVTNDEFLTQLGEYLQEDNDEFIPIEGREALWLASGSTEISPEALDYPELAWFDWNSVDWNSDNRPVITVTGLASKTWSADINDRLSRERAEKAKAILVEKYGIPEEAFVLKNTIQPADEDGELSDWQGARVTIDNLSIQNPTYVAGYDDVREKYNPSTDAVDLRLENIDPIFLAESESMVKKYIASKKGVEVDDMDTDERKSLWEEFQDDVAANKDGGLYLKWLANMKEQWSSVINTGDDYHSDTEQKDRWIALQKWVEEEYLA